MVKEKTDYNTFIVNLKIAMTKEIYDANLITHDRYLYMVEELRKRLIDK
jgi:hypothetical protein